MKQTILGQSAHLYKKRLDRRIGFCFFMFALTVGLNITLTVLRTDSNHNRMLFLNIITDVLCGVFLIYDIDRHILPRLRLYRLMCRSKTVLTGTVEHISQQSQRYMDLDCYGVTVDGRRVFLPAGTLTLKQEAYRFSLVSNIIVEAEQ